MVAMEKTRARQAFAKLLNLELDRIQAPAGRDRITWVFEHIKENHRKLVSRETVRKWIRGLDIPDQAHLRLVCKRLDLDWARLQTGAETTRASPLYTQFQEVWDLLSEDDRHEVVKYARFRVREQGTGASDESTKSVANGD